jgi:hypothetical protein
MEMEASPDGGATGKPVACDPDGSLTLSSTPASAQAAANTAVVVTIVAAAGKRHRLTGLSFAFSGANVAGTLTVEDGAGNFVLRAPYPASQTVLYNVPLPPGGIRGGVNTALIITLPAGGAAIVGTINTAVLPDA